MDFENNEKKQEETAQDGAQREYRPGRSPRPRIHTAARPAYERPSYRNNNDDEGGFRPEGFGAALQSNTPQRPQGGYRPRSNYGEGGYQQRQSGYGQRPQGGYGQRPQGSYGQRPQQGGYGRPQQGGYSRPQVATVVLSREATVVLSRVATANLTAHLLTRRVHVSTAPTTIQMQSTQ